MLMCILLSDKIKSFIPRVMSGIFGQTAEFGQPHCLYHSSIIEMNNKLTKQTVKIRMRRLIRSRLKAVSTGFLLFANLCLNLPDVPIYPTLPCLVMLQSSVHQSHAQDRLVGFLLQLLVDFC